MYNIFYIFVIIILTIIIWFLSRIFLFKALGLEWKKSQTDNNYYLVKIAPDSLEASNILGKINLLVLQLKDYLNKNKEKYEFLPYRKYIDRINQRYTYKMLSENSFNDSTSYSMNKYFVVLCLRQKDNTFVDTNTMMYVILHELTHVIADNVISAAEHSTDKEFNDVYNFLLENAEKIGIYKRVNFQKNPVPYCGLIID